jgi:hypothetical protein
VLSALGADDDVRLLRGEAVTFSRRGPGLVGIDGTVEASQGLVVLGAAVSIGGSARLSAPGGDVQVVANDGSSVTGPDGAGVVTGPGRGGSGLVNSEGRIEARRVEIISDGFLRNGGRITTAGAGNQVRLAATDVRHESTPGAPSIISTSKLEVTGAFTQDGPVILRDDGANPAGVGGLRQTPRLSGPGFVTTLDARATQLSFSPLQSAARTMSPIPARPSGPTLAARRAAGADSGESVKKLPAAGRTRAGTVRKATFFGQTFSRP